MHFYHILISLKVEMKLYCCNVPTFKIIHPLSLSCFSSIFQKTFPISMDISSFYIQIELIRLYLQPKAIYGFLDSFCILGHQPFSSYYLHVTPSSSSTHAHFTRVRPPFPLYCFPFFLFFLQPVYSFTVALVIIIINFPISLLSSLLLLPHSTTYDQAMIMHPHAHKL